MQKITAIKIEIEMKNNVPIDCSDAVTNSEWVTNLKCAKKKQITPTDKEIRDMWFTRTPKIRIETVVPHKKRK